MTKVECCRRGCEISIANPSNRDRKKFKLRNNLSFPEEFFVGESPLICTNCETELNALLQPLSICSVKSYLVQKNERGSCFIEYESHKRIGREIIFYITHHPLYRLFYHIIGWESSCTNNTQIWRHSHKPTFHIFPLVQWMI